MISATLSCCPTILPCISSWSPTVRLHREWPPRRAGVRSVASSLRRGPVETGSHGRSAAGPLGDRDAHQHGAAAAAGRPGDSCSPSSSTDQTSVSSGWASWSWLALGMPIAAMPRYQTYRPRNGRAGRDPQQPGHAVRRQPHRLVRQRQRPTGTRQRQAQHQRPADHLPARHAPGPAGRPRCSRPRRPAGRRRGTGRRSVRRAAALLHGEARSPRRRPRAPPPRRCGRGGCRCAAAENSGGGQRQQADHDGGVRGGGGLQGERGQQREADDHPAGDHGEPRPVPAGGQRHPQGQQTAARDQRRRGRCARRRATRGRSPPGPRRWRGR